MTSVVEIACVVLINFNSHAHVERDAEVTENTYIHMDFNSHAHVERDDICTEHFVNFFISTHTLTWSVTEPGRKFTLKLGISTHTLTWSVTMPLLNEFCTRIISTHTLTWSVTGK